MYAERKGWSIGAVSVSLSLRQSKEGTRSIERRVTLSAELSAEQQAKLADVCEKTPVTLVVKSGIGVRTTLASADSAAPTPR
jgi:putative redox protein